MFGLGVVATDRLLLTLLPLICGWYSAVSLVLVTAPPLVDW